MDCDDLCREPIEILDSQDTELYEYDPYFFLNEPSIDKDSNTKADDKVQKGVEEKFLVVVHDTPEEVIPRGQRPPLTEYASNEILDINEILTPSVLQEFAERDIKPEPSEYVGPFANPTHIRLREVLKQGYDGILHVKPNDPTYIPNSETTILRPEDVGTVTIDADMYDTETAEIWQRRYNDRFDPTTMRWGLEGRLLSDLPNIKGPPNIIPMNTTGSIPSKDVRGNNKETHVTNGNGTIQQPQSFQVKKQVQTKRPNCITDISANNYTNESPLKRQKVTPKKLLNPCASVGNVKTAKPAIPKRTNVIANKPITSTGNRIIEELPVFEPKKNTPEKRWTETNANGQNINSNVTPYKRWLQNQSNKSFSESKNNAKGKQVAGQSNTKNINPVSVKNRGSNIKRNFHSQQNRVNSPAKNLQEDKPLHRSIHGVLDNLLASKDYIARPKVLTVKVVNLDDDSDRD